MRRTVLALVVVAAAAALPAYGQTFIKQVFPDTPRLFVFEAKTDAQVALSLMWNREPATLFAVMVCDTGTMAFDWAASAPQQDRTLRMDVGVAEGLFCTVSIETDLTAAFAVNLQSFQPSTLAAKSRASAIRLREPEAGDAERLERLRPKLDDTMRRLRRLAAVDRGASSMR